MAHPILEARLVASVTWLEKVRLAASEAEVLEVAREFIATLDHFEVAALPIRCAPRKLLVADDVSSYALDLVGHFTDEPEMTAKTVQKLATFFTQASIRLSEVLARTNDQDDYVRRSA